MREWNITLPWPPTTNTMWRRNARSTYLSAKGKEFRKAAVDAIRAVSSMGNALIEARVEARLVLRPPTKRKIDVDNYIKAVLDALTHANFWLDDEQVDRLVVERGDVRPGGSVEVRIREMP